ncbi:MAG: sugar transferase [Armatimonadota bacterium]|nr:sugar transferase [bacterium]
MNQSEPYLDIGQDITRPGAYLAVKVCLDVIFAGVLLVLLAPLMLLIALAVRLDSSGPAIYKQKRLGRFGKTFVMWKFRSMRVGTPVLPTEQMQEQAIDPCTRLGRALRKTSLDELPQLVNILRGEMSFIGPRPALPSQEDVNELRIRQGAHRVRPGITGLAQVMGRDDLPTEIKVGYDSNYCRNMSLGNDFRILVYTVKAVVSARGNK